MNVHLCWKTENTPKGKIHRSKTMTVKEAMKNYNRIKSSTTEAYLRYFDGWRYVTYKILK
ncbi:unnamed protein product [marine sediment metagenome]|uniref:Uncharacterized protein n=1 Tax=marine sediment metagenome TaxID=412755 RepID=X1BWC7_9ZZZZ